VSENIEELILEKCRFAIQDVVSKVFLENVDFETVYDIVTQNMIHHLKWWTLGRDVSQTVVATTSYPASWWEAFKERFFPNFLQKRFPVKRVYVDTTIHHFHVCPHVNYDFGKKPFVHLSFLKGDEE
jgi:hypothetical protein